MVVECGNRKIRQINSWYLPICHANVKNSKNDKEERSAVSNYDNMQFAKKNLSETLIRLLKSQKPVVCHAKVNLLCRIVPFFSYQIIE